MIDFTGQVAVVTGAGRGLGRLYAFVGLAEGWLTEPGSEPTAEDLAARIEPISATDPYTVPASIVDEVLAMCARLGVTP